MMSNGIPLVLKQSDWPAADQALWMRCRKTGGLFRDDGEFAHWSCGTERLHRQYYGQWLSFLKRTSPSHLDCGPAARITQEMVEKFHSESVQRLKPRSASGLLLSLFVVARAFDKTADYGWLQIAARRTYRASNPYKLKKPLPVTGDQVFAWSLARIQDLDVNPRQDLVEQAMRYRQALMVGLLIACPVRSRAFVAMTLDTHVELKSGHASLHFSAKDMKDKKSRSIPVPEVLYRPLLKYIEVHREILLQGRCSNALWISARGNDLSQDSFTSGLHHLTKRHFGHGLRPHAFRHIAATYIAEKDPAHVGIIRDVLGHATLRTSELYYNRATSVSACNKLQALVQGILREDRRAHSHRLRVSRSRGSSAQEQP
ncbi:MAG: site-specific integrase [Alphaproteobacteria bacterium]|nr:site-specific integrase [Alphaproteobacteria bacterium]